MLFEYQSELDNPMLHAYPKLNIALRMECAKLQPRALSGSMQWIPVVPAFRFVVFARLRLQTSKENRFSLSSWTNRSPVIRNDDAAVSLAPFIGDVICCWRGNNFHIDSQTVGFVDKWVPYASAQNGV